MLWKDSITTKILVARQEQWMPKINNCMNNVTLVVFENLYENSYVRKPFYGSAVKLLVEE